MGFELFGFMITNLMIIFGIYLVFMLAFCIKKRANLIQKFSDWTILKGIGEYAEFLFESMFKINGFSIIGENSNEFNGLKWTRTDHDLDYIITKDNITYGVEIKNTLPYIEKEEFSIKIDMCNYLGIIPLFILRYAPNIQLNEIKEHNGFILRFKTWIFPPGQYNLVKDVWNNLRLPISIWLGIPPKLERAFLEQHRMRIQ
jgi:hypothetical protein